MGLGALSEQQLRSRGANGRPHIASCPLYHLPNYGTVDLATLDDDTVDWLQTAALSI